MLKKQKSSLLPCPDGLQQLDLGVSLFRTHPLLNNSLRHYSRSASDFSRNSGTITRATARNPSLDSLNTRRNRTIKIFVIAPA
jgi:hypothetical protein